MKPYYTIFKECRFLSRPVQELLRAYTNSSVVSQYGKLSAEILNAAICSNRINILIVTGFPILCDHEVYVENDGPLGSLVLVKALQFLPSRILIDLFCMERFMENLRCFFGDNVFLKCSVSYIARKLDHYDFIFFIEYPGASSDGTFRNARGEDISSNVVPLEHVLEEAKNLGIVTVGIGDRGNEIGMAALLGFHPRLIPENSFSNTSTRYMLWAPVSNWAAYFLSRIILDMLGVKPSHVHSSYAELQMLMKASKCGIVDGILAKRSLSVDGIPLHFNLSIVNKIFDCDAL